MIFQKIKSVLIFFVLVFVLFYFGSMIAPEPEVSFEGERSARFLDVVAVLDTIEFDFEFINSFGTTALKTDVVISPISPSDSGRDNPFKRSDTPTAGGSFDPTSLFSGEFVSPPDTAVEQEEITDTVSDVPPEVPIDAPIEPESQPSAVPQGQSESLIVR